MQTTRIGVAFDVDGVLVKGGRVLAEAVRAIERVKRSRVPFVLLTNGGGATEKAKARELSDKLGTRIAAEQMILSHSPMAALAPTYSREAVLILGKDASKEAALAYGFAHPVLSNEILALRPDIWPFKADFDPAKYKAVDLDRRVAAILSFHDSQDWGRDIQIVCDLMRTGGDVRRIVEAHHRDKTRHLQQRHTSPEQLPLYFSNGDFVWSNNLPLTRFAQGAFRVSLETVYSKLNHGRALQYTMFGKPYKTTYDFAAKAIEGNARKLGLPEVSSHSLFGIGDNPESDVAGANNNGWTSILVKTGVYEDGPHEAKYLVENVEEAVDIILKQHL